MDRTPGPHSTAQFERHWALVCPQGSHVNSHVVRAIEEPGPPSEGLVRLRVTGVPLSDRVSWGDVVFAQPLEDGATAVLDRVERRSGYVTAWLGPAEGAEALPLAALSYLAGHLAARGWQCRECPDGQLAVAVPLHKTALAGTEADPLGDALSEVLLRLIENGLLPSGTELGMTLVSLPPEQG